MGMLYFTGGVLGTLNGLLSAGLAYGKGWRRKGTGAAAALGAVFGCYEIWICGALNRAFWGMLRLSGARVRIPRVICAALSGALLSARLTDLDSREINPRSMAVYAVALLAYQASGMSLPVCINALLGAAAGALILGLPHLLRPAAIGGGDVLLLAVCGLAAGFPGVIYVLARGLAAMALVSVVQLARKKVTVHSEMPLAPFLLFGALI